MADTFRTDEQEPKRLPPANSFDAAAVSDATERAVVSTDEEPTDLDLAFSPPSPNDTETTHSDGRGKAVFSEKTMRSHFITLTFATVGCMLLAIAAILTIPGAESPATGEEHPAPQPIAVTDDQVRAGLAKLQTATSDDARWAATAELIGLGTAAAPKIRAQLTSGDFSDHTKVAAWRALAALGEQTFAADQMIRAVNNLGDIDARRAAASLLGQVCTPAHEGRLIALLADTFDPAAKINVAKSLWDACRETRHSLPALRELMRSDMTSTRMAAAVAYALTGRGEEVEDILRHLQDEPSDRGRTARWVLLQMRLQRQLERLVLQAGGRQPIQPGGADAIVDPEVSTRITEEVLSMIQERAAVEEDLVKTDELLRAAADQMLRALDPYNGFLASPQATERARERLSDGLGVQRPGVGLIIGKPAGVFRVIAALDGSPAAVAGIRPGDSITNIDDKDVYEMSIPQVDELLHGAVGETVEVKIIRAGWFVQRTFRLTRQALQAPTVRHLLLPGHVGYIRIPTCLPGTHAAVKQSLLTLTQAGAKTLVLDLRNNPGGDVAEAVNVADLFLPANQVVTYTQGRNRDVASKTEFKTTKPAETTLPVTILVDGGTADAAEILAGSLQAHKRAQLVGDVRVAETATDSADPNNPQEQPEARDKRGVTFGKGIVQAIVPLRYRAGGAASPAAFAGSAIQLTIGFYYLPGDVLIQERGLFPEINVNTPLRAGWIMDEFDKPEFVNALEQYTAGLKARAAAKMRELAQFDGREPTNWPGLSELIEQTNCKAPATVVREVVRAAARRTLAADEGQQTAFSVDFQDDRALLRTCMAALEAIGVDPASVPEYARVQ